MGMNVLIRADASIAIGSGHVMRCLTLADALRERGAQCRFVCREHPGHLIENIRQRGFEVRTLPHRAGWCPTGTDSAHAAWVGADWETDAQETELGAGKTAPDWLIVDHYALDARWERALRPHVGRIMVIDDLADRPHDCDLLLDQNLQARPDRYRGLIPETCQRLLGPRYALLRPQFLEARKSLRERDGQVRRILVAFGGVDAQGATLLALEAIARLDRPDIAVDVVITSACPHRQEIEARCGKLPNVRLHVDVENMAGLMAAADLAIGAGGSMTWERCCLGLPSLAISIAENQRSIAEACARLGTLTHIGTLSEVDVSCLAEQISILLRSPARLIDMSRSAMELVDGHGSERLVTMMMHHMVMA
jgi:UDP-2,4-diacetamido-2,4,6-trideoxy-beta-L-altropyranose hydrolase